MTMNHSIKTTSGRLGLGTLAAAALVAAASSSALAQSNVDTANKYCWSENAGWLNARDAGSPAGDAGVRYVYTYFSGFAWSENLGYVNFGNVPQATPFYSNSDGRDFGANIDSTGELFGFAWSENAGWINFDIPQLEDYNQHAFYNLAERRLQGYAWGENVGWINMDVQVEGQYVLFNPCPLDYNQDGSVNSDDLGDFITDYFTFPPIPGPGGYAIPCPANPAPYNNGYRTGYVAGGGGQCGEPNPDNLGDFITDYFIGCPS